MEDGLKSLAAIAGSVASFLYGGWTQLLLVLVALVVLDYGTGLWAGWVEGKLSSQVGRIGIARKVFIFCIVGMAHLLDTVLGENHIMRDATIFFYMVNELLSIVENGGRIGVPFPPALMKAIEVLKGKGGMDK